MATSAPMLLEATPIEALKSVLKGGFDGFMNFLQEPAQPMPDLSPQRFAEVLQIDAQTLAVAARVHRNTLRQSPHSAAVQNYLRQSVRVIRAGADISGDMARAVAWYRNEPLPPFAYKTAETLVGEGRADDVIRYITSLEAGAAG